MTARWGRRPGRPYRGGHPQSLNARTLAGIVPLQTSQNSMASILSTAETDERGADGVGNLAAALTLRGHVVAGL